MRKLLNTIYVTTPDIFISKEGETILFQKNGEKLMQLPSHNIEGIVIFNNSVITPALIQMCSQKNIHISFISYTGRFLVRLQNPIHGNVRLRRQQYRMADDEHKCLQIARSFCLAKIFNCRCVLQRLIRDHPEKINKEAVQNSVEKLGVRLNTLDRANNLQELLGIEGESAKIYYSVFDELITNSKFKQIFNGRNKRPPTDEINALLSFFYTMLSHEVDAALQTVGLDSQVGFYHQERPGRASLALDLIEELRPYIVDRFIITIINNKQISKNDFLYKESGAVLLTDDARKKVLQLWQEKKQLVITHPYLKEKIQIGLITYTQSLLLARFIRGDIDGYPPFLMR
jgi:CRISPR-associated protein Cas1